MPSFHNCSKHIVCIHPVCGTVARVDEPCKAPVHMANTHLLKAVDYVLELSESPYRVSVRYESGFVCSLNSQVCPAELLHHLHVILCCQDREANSPRGCEWKGYESQDRGLVPGNIYKHPMFVDSRYKPCERKLFTYDSVRQTPSVGTTDPCNIPRGIFLDLGHSDLVMLLVDIY